MAKSKSSLPFNGAIGPNEILIDDDTWKDHFNHIIDGEIKAHGLVPRDYAHYPKEMFDLPSQLQLIPRSEWSDRIKEKESTKSRISDILLTAGIPSMDQDGVGYCWAHSTTGCVQAVRTIANQPYVPLSAFMVAAILKKGRDEGGWCGLSAKFAREIGICSQAIWPQGSRNLSLDTQKARDNAALHKITEDWVDLTRDVYDQNLTFDMVATCLLTDIPCPVDFNWWSHSVMGCDLVEVESSSFGIRIRNSWTDSYGEKGFAVLRGSKTIPDSALAIRATGASPT